MLLGGWGGAQPHSRSTAASPLEIITAALSTAVSIASFALPSTPCPPLPCPQCPCPQCEATAPLSVSAESSPPGGGGRAGGQDGSNPIAVSGAHSAYAGPSTMWAVGGGGGKAAVVNMLMGGGRGTGRYTSTDPMLHTWELAVSGPAPPPPLPSPSDLFRSPSRSGSVGPTELSHNAFLAVVAAALRHCLIEPECPAAQDSEFYPTNSGEEPAAPAAAAGPVPLLARSQPPHPHGGRPVRVLPAPESLPARRWAPGPAAARPPAAAAAAHARAGWHCPAQALPRRHAVVHPRALRRCLGQLHQCGPALIPIAAAS